MTKKTLTIAIVIPTHNEEENLEPCLTSFANQTKKPNQVVIVDDASKDNSLEIAKKFSQKHPWISIVETKAPAMHAPGKKVVEAFDMGYSKLHPEFDLIGKFDADIVLPLNYFEKVEQHFLDNPKLGMCSGLLYIQKNNHWEYEAIANKSHIRGPIKLYTADCFKQIGGLKPSIGWDTVDVLLAQFKGFKVLTDPELKVKHLRPTGASYQKGKQWLKGEALYKMRYGLRLTLLASVKMAWQSKSLTVLLHNLQGYFKAKNRRLPYIVNVEEGKFIRQLRWRGIVSKIAP